LVRFFGGDARSKNIEGIIRSIDDCHSDFHVLATASRKDRQLREVKEKLAHASKLANELSAALADPEIFDDGSRSTFTRIEFDRYSEVFRSALDRDLSIDLSIEASVLISGLRICGGVLEILNATYKIRPDRLFLSGNDSRTSVVESAYQMCTMWKGPKLVTTPGSDFSALCSLLYEAVSGRPDEGLAGAINRYARSDDRRRWDRDSRDAEAEDDDFAEEKRVMAVRAEEIKLYEALLEDRSLSATAIALLRMRIDHEQRKHDAAQSARGPRQFLGSQVNAEQSGVPSLDKMAKLKKRMSLRAELDVELGRIRRSVRSEIDV
jgi:hypothetical protein